MPEKIIGLPPDVSQTDSRISFMVGRNKDGGLEVFDSEVVREIVDALNKIGANVSSGTNLLDMQLYSISGATLGVQIPDNMVTRGSVVEYRNAGDHQINVRFRLNSGVMTSGEEMMLPGASIRPPRHKGFEARTPDSAPSFLTVRYSE